MLIDTGALSFDIPEKGVTDGHFRFVAKDERPEGFAAAAMCANLASSIAFEKLQAQGSNLIASFAEKTRIDVVMRSANDGLGLEWDAKQVDPGRLESVRARISDAIFERTHKDRPKEKPAAEKKDEPEEDEDELVKHLIRMP